MGHSVLLGITALFLQLYYVSVADSCEVQVTIDSGPVCGRVLLAENSVSYYSFRGIPYAKPPTGERRFQAPETPDSWTEPLYATVEGPACVQKTILYGNLQVNSRGQSEDCLYANVHVPASVNLIDDSCTGLPILVFIYGGAFNEGTGNSDIYGPDYLIREDVIVITFNYRIGVLGFLSLNTTEVPGNAGLRDQIALLEWVQRNARVFGGNPDDVTVMGQSAGAASAHLLTLSNAAQGLFNRTILFSGTAIPSFYSSSPAYTQYVNNLFFTYLGINSTNTTAVYEQLLATPVTKLLYASEKLQSSTGFCTFVPVVEDEFPGVTRVIDDDPINLIGQGRGKDYPTLLSYTTDEAETFRYAILVFDLLESATLNPAVALSPRLTYSLSTTELAASALALQQRYYNGTPTEDTLIDSVTDSYFIYPAFKLAEWRSLQDGAPLYLHQYGYNSDFSTIQYGLLIDFDGAGHAEDLTYVFRTSSVLQDYVSFPPKNTDDEMKEWMTNMMHNFVRCGNPTCMNDAVSSWPPVSSGSIRYQNTAGPSYNLTEMTTEQKDMVEFFDSIDPQARAMSEQLRSSR